MAASPLFWILALALVAGVLAVLVAPLLRRATATDAPADESAATAVFRDHKRQIDADYEARTISAPERDAALAELAQRFGRELADAKPGAMRTGERSRWVAAIALAACVPVIAGALYLSLGNPAAMSAAPKSASRDHATDDAQIAAMVDQLAKRLQGNPEDGDGWALLGRSYRALGRYDAAVLAYSEAAKRLPPDASLYADWAESVAQAQGRSLQGEPTDLLEKAIKLDPTNMKALALLGSAAMERGDRAAAVAAWTKLRAQIPPDSPQLTQLDAALAAAGAPQPAAAKVASEPKATTGKTVEGRVEVDPKLAKSIGPTDTVFIFARDPDGPRMPLAAMKLVAADLPREFVLSDEMAMNPSATISKAGKVVVEVRVSKTGEVKPQAGDLTGSSAPVLPGTRDLRVTIDRVVP
ncbi:MAG TPA: c-type cytochrome biogenesis protein CcmI [Casimicrobiaceae bacterium]|nr:c-type cytochrome biogenesis protein CcmI [Casimicrobiaceae bacterium]